MIHIWEQWLIHQNVVLPSRGTWTGWRNGPTGTSWSSAKADAKSYTRGGIIPVTSTRWEPTSKKSEETWTCWSEFCAGPWKLLRDWSMWHTESERAATVQPGEEKAQVGLTDVYKYPTAERGRCSHTFSYGAQLKDTKWDTGFSTSTEDKFFHCDGGETLDKVARAGCGVFILGDVQNPSGYSPEQPAFTDLSLN